MSLAPDHSSPDSESAPPFRPFEYLHFAKTELDGARHSLAHSGVSEATEADLTADGPIDSAVLQERGRDLRAAWCAGLGERYGVPATHITSALGASGAVFDVLSALSTLHPERRTLLIEDPAYGVFESVGRFLGLTIRRLPRPAAQRFAVDPEQVLRHVAEEAPLAICLTDLHNPTGMRLGDDVVAALREICATHAVPLVLDEVYRDSSPGDVGTAYRPGAQILTVSSLTKCYGVAGARAGWICAPPHVLERIDLITEITCGVPPSTSFGVALNGLRCADTLRKRALRTAKRARPVVDAWVDRTDGVSWQAPDAGLTGLVTVDGLTDSLRFARSLRRELDVQVIPGAFFGAEGTLRLSFGLPPASLQQALDVLALGLGALVE